MLPSLESAWDEFGDASAFSDLELDELALLVAICQHEAHFLFLLMVLFITFTYQLHNTASFNAILV